MLPLGVGHTRHRPHKYGTSNKLWRNTLWRNVAWRNVRIVMSWPSRLLLTRATLAAARKRPNVAGPQHARFESVPPRPTHPAAGYGGSIPHPQSPVPPPGYYQPISSSPKPRRPPPIPTAAPPARPPLPHSTTQRSKRPSNPTQWQAPPVSAPRPHPDVIDLTLSNPDLGSLSSTRPLYPSVHPHLGSSEQGSLHGMVPAGPAHWHGDNRLMPGGFSPQYMEQRMLRVAGSTRGVEEMSLPDAASSSSHTAWDRDVAQPTIIAPFPAPSPAPTTKTATKRKRKAQDDDPAGVSGTVDVAEKAPAKRLKTGVKRARKVPPVDVEHISSATSKTGPAKRSEPTPSSKTLPLPSNVQVTASSRSATPQHCQPEAVAASSRQATPARWQLEYKPAPRPPLPPHLAGVIIASDIDIIALGRKEYHEIQASKATAVRKMTATGTKGLKSTEVVKNSRLVPPPAPPVMAATALATDALGMCKPSFSTVLDTDPLLALPQPTDDDEFDNLFGPDLVDGE